MRRRSSQVRSLSRRTPSSPSDEAQRITLFNWGAERIFGYTADEAIGAPLDLLLPDHSRRRHATDIAEFARSAQTARRMGERSTILGRRKNGEIFPAEGRSRGL